MSCVLEGEQSRATCNVYVACDTGIVALIRTQCGWLCQERVVYVGSRSTIVVSLHAVCTTRSCRYRCPAMLL